MAGFNRVMELERKIEKNKKKALKKIGIFVQKKQKLYCPVKTGYLKSRNYYRVSDNNDRVTWMNDAPYAGYVDFGTSKMIARRFFRVGLESHVSEIAAIARSVFGDI